MACGNNKVSRTGLHSQPTLLSHPVLARVDQSVRQRAFEAARAADRQMDHAKHSLQTAMSRADVRTALDSALRALDAARRAGGDKLARNRVRDLERQIQQLRREADEKETEIAGRDVQRIAMTEMRSDMMFRDTMGRQSLGVPMLRMRPMTGTAGTTTTGSGQERATVGSAQGHTTAAPPLSGQTVPAQPSNQARAASPDSTLGLAQAERLAASAHTKTLSELVEDKKVAQRVLSAAINAQRPADELSRLKASVKTIQRAEAKAAAKVKADAKAEEDARAASSSLAFGSWEGSGLLVERSETITLDTRMTYDKLTPNTEYKVNGQTYVTDSNGVPAYAAAELRLEKAGRHSQGTEIGHMGEKTDVGGHLIAARFGGIGSGPNVIPQNVKLNGNSALEYGQMEATWNDLLKSGARVFVDIRLEESKDIAARPEGIYVRFTVDPAGADLAAVRLEDFADGGIFENFFPNSAP
jgi:hypothetical protein